MHILTSKQFELLKLWSKGLSLSEIASKLDVSRQAAHKGIQIAEAKVYKALMSTAKASKIEVKKINAKKGFLVGWSPWLKK
ncbi:MAG: HTH domain-containing protein [Candidatus Nezhaarchaeales archaeon]